MPLRNEGVQLQMQGNSLVNRALERLKKGGVSTTLSSRCYAQYSQTTPPVRWPSNWEGSVLKQKREDKHERHLLMLTKNQVALRLSVSESTVHRLIKTGALSSLKIGRSVRISENSLSDFILMAGGSNEG
jgi:excisionase family DNA binding protein